MVYTFGFIHCACRWLNLFSWCAVLSLMFTAPWCLAAVNSSVSTGNTSSSAVADGCNVKELHFDAAKRLADNNGSLFHGEFEPNDCRAPDNPNHYIERYQFTIQTEQHFGLTAGFSLDDSTVVLRDAQGSLIYQASNAIYSGNVKALTPGTYTIEVAGAQGGYSFSGILANPGEHYCPTNKLDWNFSGIPGELNARCQSDSMGEIFLHNYYSMSLEKPSLMSFRISGNLAAKFIIKDTQGKYYTELASEHGNQDIYSRINLPAGNYIIDVTSQAAFTWSTYSFYYQNLSMQNTPTATPGDCTTVQLSRSVLLGSDSYSNANITGEISDGDCVADNNPNQLLDRYAFSAEENQRFAIELQDMNDFRLMTFRLRGDDGEVVYERPPGGSFSHSMVALKKGNYRLEVFFEDQAKRQAYKIHAVLLAPTPQSQCSPHLVNIEEAQYLRDIEFLFTGRCTTGSRGENYLYHSYEFSLKGLSDVYVGFSRTPTPYFYLKNQQGQIIAEYNSEFLIRLPAGQYTLEVTTEEPFTWGHFYFYLSAQEPNPNLMSSSSSSTSASSSGRGGGSSSGSISASSASSAASSSSGTVSTQPSLGGSMDYKTLILMLLMTGGLKTRRHKILGK